MTGLFRGIYRDNPYIFFLSSHRPRFQSSSLPRWFSIAITFLSISKAWREPSTIGSLAVTMMLMSMNGGYSPSDEPYDKRQLKEISKRAKIKWAAESYKYYDALIDRWPGAGSVLAGCAVYLRTAILFLRATDLPTEKFLRLYTDRQTNLPARRHH